MKDLYFIVEGETEEEFIKRLLIPYLYKRGLSGNIQAILIQISGGGHGHSNTAHFLNTIEPVLYYSGEPVITSLLDFFRFPQKQEPFAACQGQPTAAQQLDCLQVALQQAVQGRRPYLRFIPYIQLHEFEALLFADASGYELLPPAIGAAVARVRAAYDSPEDINSGAEYAPSKRLAAIYTAAGQRYRKVADAVDILELIGLDVIMTQCARFQQWVESLIMAVQL